MRGAGQRQFGLMVGILGFVLLPSLAVPGLCSFLRVASDLANHEALALVPYTPLLSIKHTIQKSTLNANVRCLQI